jgi:hypothetical protein
MDLGVLIDIDTKLHFHQQVGIFYEDNIFY